MVQRAITNAPTTLNPYGTGGGANTGRANEMDLLGDSGGAEIGGLSGIAPGAAASDYDKSAWERANRATEPKNLIDPSKGPSSNPLDAQRAYEGGNIGGATGEYNAVSDQGRKEFDYYQDLQDPSTVSGLINSMGEKVGVSRAGDAMVGGVGDTFQVGTPYDALDRVVDPQTGLGVSGQGAPVTGMTPGTTAAAEMLQGATPNTPGDLATAGVNGIGDALDNAMGGPGGGIPVDASGADRGGFGLGGAYGDDFARMRGLGDSARGLGSDVMAGAQMPGGQGAQGQTDVMGKALNFKPTAQTGVMKELDSFRAAPSGASEAEQLLSRAAQGNMADALSLARSGRARDAGSQARALNIAQAENAATGVDTARDVGALRAKEAEARRAQDLQALSQKGALATGTDQSKLSALNLGGDLASQLRNANVQERGQSLNFAQGQQQIGAGLESDVLKTIPQLENIRHQDEFDLTPQQKIAAAKLGGPPDKTTTDYVIGMLGDVLGVL